MVGVQDQNVPEANVSDLQAMSLVSQAALSGLLNLATYRALWGAPGESSPGKNKEGGTEYAQLSPLCSSLLGKLSPMSTNTSELTSSSAWPLGDC